MRKPYCLIHVRTIAAVLIVVLLLAVSPGLIGAQAPGDGSAGQTCGLDFWVPDGRFFADIESASGAGFDVIDDEQARFWTAFQSLGGQEALGRPISQRFSLDGFLVQAFERGVLQWDPANQATNVLNTLDVLHQAGYEEWLAAEPRRIPAHQGLPEDAGASFDQVVQNHLAILDNADAGIREAFEGTPNWLARLGLPIAYADYGDLRVLRAQRGVLRQSVTDGQVGAVEVVGAGALARDAGLFPTEGLAPTQPRLPADLTALLRIDPENPEQGSTVVVAVTSGYADMTLRWDGQPLPLVCTNGQWHALAGLASTAEPDEHTLQIALGETSAELSVVVAERAFPHEVVELPEALRDLLDPERSRQEGEFFRAMLDQASGPPRWDGAFGQPADGRPTSGYGERRTFQPGAVSSLHEGTDIAAPQGTPVWAPNRGVVAWTGPLTIRGNVVILDHGFGVFTAFYHLDRIDVASGDEVVAGDVIGTIGSTGLSTGPHLHWEVRVLGTAVDPNAWTERTFDAITGWTGFVPADATAAPSGEGDGETQPADGDSPPAENPENGGPTTPTGVETGVPPDEGPAG